MIKKFEVIYKNNLLILILLFIFFHFFFLLFFHPIFSLSIFLQTLALGNILGISKLNYINKIFKNKSNIKNNYISSTTKRNLNKKML